jgi:hypothetical protein
MEKKRFSLDIKESARWEEWVQIVFGAICIIVFAGLIIYNLKSASDKSTWTGIYFLFLFGIYQIWAGFGFAKKFIEIGSDKIRLKKNSIGRINEINASDIERIESLPLNVIFRLRNNSKIVLRFGVSYPGRIEAIENELLLFARENKLIFEIKEEKV